MNTIDLVARLLATENLTIVRNNAKTAFFDIKSRVLSLPLWKDMTPELESMFVAHEVGHALYTTDEYIVEAKATKGLQGYLNVVEDARIEKLMKRKFPGIRKTFFAGYNQLMEKDFFELGDRDLSTMLLVDRINLYFKAGYKCGVKFTKTEKDLVDRVERAETMDDVIVLAKEVFAYDKTAREEVKKQMEELEKLQGPGESDDFGDSDYDLTDEYEESDEELEADSDAGRFKEGIPILDKEILNDNPRSETDEKLKQKLEELADDTIEYRYYTLDTEHVIDPIVPFKRVIQETAEFDRLIQMPEHAVLDVHKNFQKFMQDSDKMVNYLVKEFEMRKSASAYKRAKVSKSGSLNVNKLFAHKISDDIFKRITVVPNGKNHGMVFLLDWSGSMHDVIMPTVKQVINLCMFCRRINIPFEVYAFSGAYGSRKLTHEQHEKRNLWVKSKQQTQNKNILFTDNCYHLLQLFSHRMTNNEFNTVARRFSSHLIGYIPGYSLGDTPLNDALLYMMDYLPKFRKQNNVEKLTFITLTDGQSSQLMYNKYISEREWNGGKTKKVKNFLRDVETGKDYAVTAEAYTQTEVMLRMIREHNQCKVLGFYICKNRMSDLRSVLFDHLGGNYHSREYDSVVIDMRSNFKKDGFHSLQNTGRDDLFIIPNTATEIQDADIEGVSSDLSAAAIAKKFGKMFNNKKHSRVLLDKFIGYVA